MLTTGVLAVLVPSIAVKVCAQTLSVKNYTTQDGLPSAEVFHILQDRSGFLWFSTSNGIASFDGYEMKAFSGHDGVPDPLVLETREDEAGRIWMRSFSGRISYHYKGVVHPFVFNDTLSKFCSKGYLEAFAQDTTGRWVFYESDDQHGTIEDDGSISRQRLALARIAITDYGDQLVIQSSLVDRAISGTVIIEGKEFPINIPSNDPKYNYHYVSVTRWKGSIYFSVRNNVFRYDGHKVTCVLIAGAPIIDLSIDKKDRLYVGHINRGTVQFSNENFQEGDTLDFTRNHSVTDVLEDHEGGLWFSTLEAGVFYVPSTGIHHYFLPGNPRIRTALVHNRKILIGTNDGLLMALDEKSKVIIGRQKFERSILSLYAHEDTVFAGTSSYLYILRDVNRRPLQTYVGSVLGFAEDHDTVWALTGRTIAFYLRNGVQTHRTRYDRAIRNVYVKDSIYYVVPHLGLEICDQRLATLAKPKSLQYLKVSQLHPVNDTTLLIGTIGSGLIVANKVLTRITRFESLPHDIYHIVKLDENYYFASEEGIFKVSMQDLISQSVRMVLLNANNGLLNKSISLLETTSDKKLIVFYDNAFSIVDPEGMQVLNGVPRFYIDRITVNNRMMKNLQHYHLPYDSNTVQLDFGFVSFNNQDINIRYRLHERDSWIYPRRTNFINLYSLSPGFYTPELEYSADRFTWQKAKGLPTFNIAYPWWQNPYLQGVSFVIVFIVGFTIVRNRLEIHHERNKRLKLLTVQQQQLLDTEKETTDRERNRIAKDLHDSVGSSLLATKLSIGRILKRYNHQEADEIELQLSNTLNEIKNIIYDLSPTELERDGLSKSVKNYIDKLSGVTDMQLNVIFYGDDIMDVRITLPVFRILQELFSNSIKYSNGTSISVHINSFDKLLNIVYEDNGNGFSPKLSKGLGRGLSNIDARVRTLDGQAKFDSGAYGTSCIIDIPKAYQATTL